MIIPTGIDSTAPTATGAPKTNKVYAITVLTIVTYLQSNARTTPLHMERTSAASNAPLRAADFGDRLGAVRSAVHITDQ